MPSPWRRYISLIAGLGFSFILSFIISLFDLAQPYQTIAFSISGILLIFFLGYCFGNIQSPSLGVLSIDKERDKISTNKFIMDAIKKSVKSCNSFQIDCLGIKHESMSHFLENNYKKYDWETSKIRILLTNKNSEGIKTRAIIGEADEEVLIKRIDTSLTNFEKVIKNKIHDKCNIEVKLYDFLPSFYIIRINNYMLVGFYLKIEGYKAPYMILENKKDSLFNYFSDYFDKIYNTALSYSPESINNKT